MNKLNLVQDHTPAPFPREDFKPKSLRELTKARFERLWKKNPHQFDPLRNARERTRVERTLQFIQKHLDLSGLKIVDLGSGSGYLSRQYSAAGGIVDAVDVAHNATSIKEIPQGITPIVSCVPNTHLDDGVYDLAACTELIGHLSQREHRLFFNELARLVKTNGMLLFSTAVDIYSEDALDRLIGQMQTEWEIIDYHLSYHSRHIRLANFFSMPRTFALASQDKEMRERLLKERVSIWKQWFKCNTHPNAGALWKTAAPLFDWISRRVKQSENLLLGLEKISHSEASISHIIVLAKRKRLFTETGD